MVGKEREKGSGKKGEKEGERKGRKEGMKESELEGRKEGGGGGGRGDGVGAHPKFFFKSYKLLKIEKLTKKGFNWVDDKFVAWGLTSVIFSLIYLNGKRNR